MKLPKSLADLTTDSETPTVGDYQIFLDSLLETYDFLCKYARKPFRRMVTQNYGAFVSRRTVFAAFQDAQIWGVGILGPARADVIAAKEGALAPDDFDPNGDRLYVGYLLVHPKMRGQHHAKHIIHDIISMARDAYPNVTHLVYNRAFRGDYRLRERRIR